METKDIHKQIENYAHSRIEAYNDFIKKYKEPFDDIVFKTIRNRIIELDGRNEKDIEKEDKLLDFNGLENRVETREYLCRLRFYLPYTNNPLYNGCIVSKRYYNLLSTGIDLDGKFNLYLGVFGSPKENEEYFQVTVSDDAYYWLYNELLRMGFFNDELKEDFKLWDE